MGLLRQLIETNAEKEPYQSKEIDMAIASSIDHISSFAQGSGIQAINLLMIGGASLHLNGFRGHFADIDLMVDGIELSSKMEQHAFDCPNSNMSIELFYQNKITTINDPKMFQRSRVLRVEEKDGINYTVSCYPPEFFLLMKMEMGRDKCQKDIQIMLQNIPQADIIRSFNELAKYNESWVMSDAADMLITDLIMLNLPGSSMGDDVPSLSLFCKELDIPAEKKKDLMMMCRIVEMQNKKKAKSREYNESQPSM